MQLLGGYCSGSHRSERRELHGDPVAAVVLLIQNGTEYTNTSVALFGASRRLAELALIWQTKLGVGTLR